MVRHVCGVGAICLVLSLTNLIIDALVAAIGPPMQMRLAIVVVAMMTALGSMAAMRSARTLTWVDSHLLELSLERRRHLVG